MCVNVYQTLRNMHGHSIIAQTLILLSSTKTLCVRKTLEAWHTSATKHADNNSKPLSNQVVLFLNNSRLIYTFFSSFICFFLSYFLPSLFLHIFHHFAFIVIRQRSTSESSFSFSNFLATERFYCNLTILFIPKSTKFNFDVL